MQLSYPELTSVLPNFPIKNLSKSLQHDVTGLWSHLENFAFVFRRLRADGWVPLQSLMGTNAEVTNNGIQDTQ